MICLSIEREVLPSEGISERISRLPVVRGLVDLIIW